MVLTFLSRAGRYLAAEGPSFLLWFCVVSAVMNAFRHTPAVPSEVMLAGLVGWALLVSWRGWHRAWKRAVDAEAELKGRTEPGRTFVQNPREVLALSGRPGYDALQKVAPLIDQWISITGCFEGSAELLTRDAYAVTVRTECGRTIHLKFRKSAELSLNSLRAGQIVTVICRIGFSDRLVLFDCELVEARPVSKVRCA